jgi:hypothetical protein
VHESVRDEKIRVHGELVVEECVDDMGERTESPLLHDRLGAGGNYEKPAECVGTVQEVHAKAGVAEESVDTEVQLQGAYYYFDQKRESATARV